MCLPYVSLFFAFILLSELEGLALVASLPVQLSLLQPEGEINLSSRKQSSSAFQGTFDWLSILRVIHLKNTVFGKCKASFLRTVPVKFVGKEC